MSCRVFVLHLAIRVDAASAPVAVKYLEQLANSQGDGTHVIDSTGIKVLEAWPEQVEEE